jgi:hypothetical protein
MMPQLVVFWTVSAVFIAELDLIFQVLFELKYTLATKVPVVV